jgi:hypothetical protein
MTAKNARWWDEHVQPRIDHGAKKRADQGWNWPLYRTTTRLAGSLLLQKPRAVVIGSEHAAPTFWPCIMLLVVEAYPALQDHSRNSVFVWYLSPAPADYFADVVKLTSSETPSATDLMAAGMDVAITLSYNARLRGLVGLHAAAAGGDRLIAWYSDPAKGGMNRLQEPHTIPLGLRRLLANDDRYFYHDEVTAFVASWRMDKYERRGG